jgi:hypothetical protein
LAIGRFGWWALQNDLRLVMTATATRDLSEAGRRRMLAVAGEPLFLATWARAVFIHYEADPALLQRQIPFQLDLC